MSIQPPDPIDVSEIQFKLHNKSKLFHADVGQFQNCNLLASASAYGLVIIGCQTPEIKVIQLSSIVNIGNNVSVRPIPLMSVPQIIALSCDHSMLAVYFVHNGISFATIFSVPSFLSTHITAINRQNIVLSPEPNVGATELLWNPVVSNTLAVCLNNGSLLVVNFKDQGNELFNIDKTEQVRCASWSPKGKQIVVGFPNGKLAQYKPDLKLARTIPFADNVYPCPFDMIAVQWLSTYQFAAVFLKQEQGACPALFIINAPKNVPPTYINYDDICYSQSGPRRAGIFLCHILPWNLILVGSANSIEIGVLGTNESGETPKWTQYTMLDEARAELPLSADKQETYPIGFALETGCTHQLTINETLLPVMPMLHLLSTNGTLVSFNIINNSQNSPSLCSPPQPVADTSGLCYFQSVVHIEVPTPNVAQIPTTSTEMSFLLPDNAATSTPAAHKPKVSLFGTDQQPKPVTSLFGAPVEPQKQGLLSGNGAALFGGQTSIQPLVQPSAIGSALSSVPKSGAEPTSTFSSAFGSVGTAFGSSSPFGKSGTVAFGGSQQPLFGGTGATVGGGFCSPSLLGTPHTQPVQSAAPLLLNPKSSIQPSETSSKPFLTVAPTYSPPAAEAPTSKSMPKSAGRAIDPNDDDSDVIRKMMSEEIQSFEQVWKGLLIRSKKVNIKIGTKEEMTIVAKQLSELQDITDQATESTETLTSEVQSLRISLNEAFSMATEARSKHSLYNDIDYHHLRHTSAMSQTNRRQLEKLQSLLAINENQYQTVSKQIDAYWSTHQTNVRMTVKAKMHIPQLENVYMTLSKQRSILNSQKHKISFIKSKIGYRDFSKTPQKSDTSVNSLADSIFSMSLCDQVKMETERLSTEKIASLRELLRNRTNIAVIKPKRPERKGLNSEVVMERKLAQAKKNIPQMTKVKLKDTLEPKTTSTPNEFKDTMTDKHASNVVKEKLKVTVKAKQKASIVLNPLAVQNISKTATPTTTAFSFSSTAANIVASSKSNTPSIFGPANTQFSTNTEPSRSQTTASAALADFGMKTSNTANSVIPFGDINNKPLIFDSYTTTVSPFAVPAASLQSMSFGFATGTAATASSSPLTFGTPTVSSSPSLGTSTSTTKQPMPLNTVPIKLTTATEPKSEAQPHGLLEKVITSDKENQPIDEIPKSTSSPAPQSKKPLEPAVTLVKPTATPPVSAFSTTLNGSAASALSSASAQPTSLFSTISGLSSSALPSMAVTTNSPFGSIGATIITAATTSSSFSTSIFGGAQSSFTSQLPATAATAITSSIFSDVFNIHTSSEPTTPATTVTATTAVATVKSVAPSSNTISTTNITALTEKFNFALESAAVTSAVAVMKSSSAISVASTETVRKPVVSSEQTVSAAVDTTDKIFQGLNVCQPNIATTAATVSSPAGTNIFSMPSFTSPKSSDASPPSIFGGSVTASSASPFGVSAFGTNVSTAAVPATSTISSSPFAAFVAQNPVTTVSSGGTSIFGGMPKPDQSVFGNAASGSSIFGGGSTGGGENIFSTPTASPNSFGGGGSSIFGGAPGSATSPFGSTIAGGGASTGSLFGGQQSAFGQTAAAPSTNIFQQPIAIGSSGTSIFGGSSAFGGSPAETTPNSIFGGGGSTLSPSAFGGNSFGQSSGQPAFGSASGGTSIFGGQSAASPFGGGAPSGGSFMQGGASISQTGFGGPVNSVAQSTAVGGFGGPPAFGTPSFGGAATFGSPKSSFGGFGQSASPPAFTTQVTQKNSLFESLGSSSESGMTFGNIAQSSNTTSQNSSFTGGSSFSSWR